MAVTQFLTPYSGHISAWLLPLYNGNIVIEVPSEPRQGSSGNTSLSGAPWLVSLLFTSSLKLSWLQAVPSLAKPST